MKNAHCKLTQTLQQYYTAKNRLLLTGKFDISIKLFAFVLINII